MDLQHFDAFRSGKGVLVVRLNYATSLSLALSVAARAGFPPAGLPRHVTGNNSSTSPCYHALALQNPSSHFLNFCSSSKKHNKSLAQHNGNSRSYPNARAKHEG